MSVDRSRFESLEPGLYRTGETRKFTGEIFDICNNVMIRKADEPQVQLASVFDSKWVPDGQEDAWRRADGLVVAVHWMHADWNVSGWQEVKDLPRKTMRKLTDHIVSGDQAVQLEIDVMDEPGAGGANHLYRVSEFDASSNPSNPMGDHSFSENWALFQNGPIKESGVNGVTQEALLAIVIDRLRSFQAGPFSCRENAIALTHLEEGLMWLQRRTVARIKRGVEGTHQK